MTKPWILSCLFLVGCKDVAYPLNPTQGVTVTAYSNTAPVTLMVVTDGPGKATGTTTRWVAFPVPVMVPLLAPATAPTAEKVP